MDLMEFSMTEGNDTLTGDENFLPPQLMQTPVVVHSILKPSTKGNLMQLHTPKPQQKHLKVKFETPHAVKKVTPTRYEQIADLDEKENWIERTTIVTKTEHMSNIECAQDILTNIVENLPLLKSESTTDGGKPGNESDDEEAFFDASDETDKATSDALVHPTLADTLPVPQQVADVLPVSVPQQVAEVLPVSAPQQVAEVLPVSAPQQVAEVLAVSAPQEVADTFPVSVPPGGTGILDVSMECGEADGLVTEEPMECDETAMEVDLTVICNKTLIEDKAVSYEMLQDNPVTMVTSPPLPSGKGAYSIDFDKLDSFNPFQAKGGISNSPVLDVEMHSKVDAEEKIVAEQAPLKTGTVESVLESQAPEGILGIEADVDLLSEVLPDVDGDQVQGIYDIDFEDKADPFATKSQVQNSPVSADPFTTKSQVQNSPLSADPFVTKSQVQNSPVSAEPFTTKSQVQNSLSADPFVMKSQVQNSPASADPFTTKSQVQNSPASADPFTTKSQVQNSPLSGDQFTTKSQVQNSPASADPFTTKSQVQNSPASADPFTTKSQVQNSPVSADPFTTKSQVQNSPLSGDQFTTKSQVQNSPASADPFTTKSQVQNSPLSGDQFTTKSQVQNSPLSADPFATKSQVQNSPFSADPFATKSQVQNSAASADPFTTKSQVQNSPLSADSFTTKSQVQNSPVSADPFTTKSQVQNSLSADPFVTKSQVQNSPLSADPFTTKSKVQNSPLSADPFTTKSQVQNSPASADPITSTSQVQNSPLLADPLVTKLPADDNNIQSLPVNGDVATPKRPMKIDDGEPFSTKSNIMNSPPLPATVLNNSNPFATKSNVCNSPILSLDDMAACNSQLQPSNEKDDAEKVKSNITTLPVSTLPESSTLNSSNHVANPTAVGSEVTPKKTLGIEVVTDPISVKANMANSPSSVAVDAINSCNPFATKSSVVNSPVAGGPVIEENPFVSNTKMSDSSEVVQSVNSQSDEGKALDIKFDDLDLLTRTPSSQIDSASETAMGNVCDAKLNTDKYPAPATTTDKAIGTVSVLGDDPFTTKSKVPNSPPSSATGKKDPLADLDPFNTKSKVANSPTPLATAAKDPITDPFNTKSKVPNSPTPSATSKVDPMIDPFNTKSKVPNSPTPSATSTVDPMIDPFNTKSKIPNSPTPSATSTVDPMIDPFNTKSKIPNSPTPSTTSTVDPMIDPFNTKSKVPNSPTPSATSKVDPMIDPFKTKSKVPNSPTPSATSTVDPMIDPFNTKSNVPNSPTPSATSTVDPMIDPFTTKSKVPNSPREPTKNAMSDSSVTKSEVPNLPGMTSQQVNVSSSSEIKFPETGFKNVASRNMFPETAPSGPDFSDEEFRPATDCLFNDSSFLDVLEKFGNSNTESKVSDLARMSLYVKFDPLVDLPVADPRRASMNLLKRASIMNMPRRSLSGKSLSEVCNPEESMLLMGTPPKQMSQRLANIASRPQSGYTPGSLPTTPKAFKPQLDLLCANTPPRSVRKSTTPAPAKVNSNLSEDPADNLAGGSDDNIVEVLQYTDKDMCEVKTSLFLEFQGQKLLLEREWTKVVDKLKAKIEEQNKTLEKKQADIELMGNISKELENIVEGLIQEKEKGKVVTTDLQKERDQAIQDTQSLEKAFSELHRRNEKLKEALSGYVKNQEALTAHAKELQKALTAVKTDSKEKITELTQQLTKAKSDLNQITTSSEARTKRDKLQLESLQKTVDQKMSENKELTQMCDDLLAKVS